MPDRYPPIASQCPHMLHGGDYNPDQWTPDIWEEDMRLARLSGCNAMSVGIFAWARMEPTEGHYDFGWLDTIMDKLAAQGAIAVMATPSGARPAWMSRKYPEVLRTEANRVRNLHGVRHNHCLTSPVYRQKTAQIARILAERYREHPALGVWHMSNEYNGACYCPMCQEAFREWLKRKYGTLDNLNHEWWTDFWAHTYSCWEEIEAPAPHGEPALNGLNLDWQRFTTDQTIDFCNNEAAPLRELTPNVPITTNFMGTYVGLNYPKFAEHLDVVSWDNYPSWHHGPEAETACEVSFTHDINRSLKHGRPYMMMESVPSTTNWMPCCKLKRPGMHVLSSLQAIAHGSDTVQYFQWRKSRGGPEKFHGAVVDHEGTENTRVFKDVADLGQILAKLDDVVGTTCHPKVGLIFDWENRWAIEGAQGPRQHKGYPETVLDHYRPFWQAGVSVDVFDSVQDFSSYKLLIAPMLYMLRPGVAERLKAFVAGGGTLVSGYWSGIVNENDLVHLGGWPGEGLRQLFGVWAEEIDGLWDDDRQTVAPTAAATGLSGEYEAKQLCDLIHAEGSDVLATYTTDFYAGLPAVTVNKVGAGAAYYVAARLDRRFQRDFFGGLCDQLGIEPTVPNLPEGVTAQTRTDGERKFVFVLNFNPAEAVVKVGPGYTDVLTGEAAAETLTLPTFGYAILVKPL